MAYILDVGDVVGGSDVVKLGQVHMGRKLHHQIQTSVQRRGAPERDVMTSRNQLSFWGIALDTLRDRQVC